MSFLWYDLETFGKDPRRTRISQFAAIRTDDDLNEIGEPLSFFCRPARDLLPAPEAVLVTGITPQQADREGTHEAAFISRVHEQLAEPDTCSVGYNSLRFDESFLRFALYRNFHDPYAYGWQFGNSRWDLLDVFRFAAALRPEGLVWPTREDGLPSFKLEHLAQANGVREGDAHEALSDVRALLALARRLKAAQPKLWAHCLEFRDKRRALRDVDPIQPQPLLHVSGMMPAARYGTGIVLPICSHPSYKDRVIVLDLDEAPASFLDADADEIADRLYTPKADLPEGVSRVPLKEIRGSFCPISVPLSQVRDVELERLGLDRHRALAHATEVLAHKGFAAAVARVFGRSRAFPAGDADGALYDGFIGESDKRLFPNIRSSPPAALPGFADALRDPRLGPLLLRYQARNWPETLTFAQREAWDDYRRARFAEGSELGELDAPAWRERIEALRKERTSPRDVALLDALSHWGESCIADVT